MVSLQGSQSKWYFDTDPTLGSTVDGSKLKIDNKSRSLSDIDLNTEYPKYSRDQWSQNIDSIIETIKKFI